MNKVTVSVRFDVEEMYRGFAIVEHGEQYDAIYQGKCFDGWGNGFSDELACWFCKDLLIEYIDVWLGEGFELVDSAKVKEGDQFFDEIIKDWMIFNLLWDGDRTRLVFRRETTA
jgi:hypothetical protein